MRDKINTPHDIIGILKENPDFDDWLAFGLVNVKREGNKYLFNYRAEAGYEDDWNQFELMSRGLIVDPVRDKILAYPFDKFFNWGQQYKTTTARLGYVMEKMDGSLGVCWYDHDRLSWRITTRGSFNSEQAIWATNFFHEHFAQDFSNSKFNLENPVTMLFEIIYHDNRIVVDYDYEGLVLLGVRHSNGKYFNIHNLESLAFWCGFPLAKTFKFNNPDEIIEELKNLDALKTEGFVAVFQDGSRFKFKGDEYLKLHKLLSNLSFKNVLKAISEDTFDKLIESIPDEFLPVVKQWQNAIWEEYWKVKIETEEAHMAIHDSLDELSVFSRKSFAQIVMSKYKHLSAFLFAMLDNKLTDSLIWRKHDFSFIEDEIVP